MASLIEVIGREVMKPDINYTGLAELVAADRAGEASRTMLEFAQIQQTLENVVGGRIPRLLVEGLALSDSTWTGISTPHSRSAFFITGGQSINDARAIIEIEKWEEKTERTTRPVEITRSLVPWHLRISGVTGENGADHRIIAVQYGVDVAGFNTASNIQVSVNENEIPPAEASPLVNSATADFSREEGYLRAGLVTPAMISAVYDSDQTAQAINLYVQKMSIRIQTKEAERYGFRGLYINGYGMLAAIGYQERDHPQRSPVVFPNDSWGIIVPLKLEKEGYI